MRLALFDLDNTLLAGDSDFEWAQFLIGKGVLDREVYEARNQQFYEQYKAGTLDIHEFLDFQLKIMLFAHGAHLLSDTHDWAPAKRPPSRPNGGVRRTIRKGRLRGGAPTISTQMAHVNI